MQNTLLLILMLVVILMILQKSDFAPSPFVVGDPSRNGCTPLWERHGPRPRRHLNKPHTRCM